MVEEEVGGNVAQGWSSSHGAMGHEWDNEVKDCTAQEEELEGYEDKEYLVCHLDGCMSALRS